MNPEECFQHSLEPGTTEITSQKNMELFVAELAKNGHITQQDTWITSLFPQPSPTRPVTFENFKRAVIDTEFKNERLAFEEHCAHVDESMDLLERQVKKALSYPSDVVNLHFILNTIQDLKQTIAGSTAATDNEQDNKVQRYRNFFWSRIDGVDPPIPQPIAQRIAYVGQLVKNQRKKVQPPVKSRSGTKKQICPGVCCFAAQDAAKNMIDVIEVDALTASYTAYHKEALDFEIAREFLPSHCFRSPLDMRCETGDKVWFMYDSNRYLPILSFFRGPTAIGEQSPLFAHWRSRIASALCDLTMYGSKRLAAPLGAANINVTADGDQICIVDAEWGADKDVEAHDEPLAIPSLIKIIDEIILPNLQGPVLKCILEIAREGGCTIFDIVRHPYFRALQSQGEVKNQIALSRSKGGETSVDD